MWLFYLFFMVVNRELNCISVKKDLKKTWSSALKRSLLNSVLIATLFIMFGERSKIFGRSSLYLVTYVHFDVVFYVGVFDKKFHILLTYRYVVFSNRTRHIWHTLLQELLNNALVRQIASADT